MAEFTSLAERLSDLMFDQHPLRANLMGLRDDGALGDRSEEADQRFRARYAEIIEDAERATPASLDERITKAIVLHQARAQIDAIDAKTIEFGVSSYVQAPVPELLYLMPHLRNHDAVPQFIATVGERHRAGIARGLKPVKHLVEQAIALMDSHTGPAIEHYREVLRELVPHGRDTEHAGLCWLPGGEELYRSAVRAHTTSDLDPHELHEIGKGLIENLQREFAQYPDAFERIRHDQNLKYASAEEVVELADAAMQRAEAVAPQWFRTMPNDSCVIAEMPPSTPVGTPPHYLPAALDGSRPGTYYVNTRQPRTLLKIVAEATAFHEAVPGHHFEHSKAMQHLDQPLLRRKAPITAFGEGWALYCERLADEMGLYSSDEARLGMLTMDAKRAGRLVADTGLHAKGWSRQQAIDYLLDNTPMPRELAEAEVDRYLAQPAQALAYMVGRLKFDEVRKRAESALGRAFDIRDFHEAVLRHGRVTLALLDDVVDDWIAQH